MSRLGLVVVVLVLGGSTAWADPTTKAAVRKLAKEFAAATVAGDYAKVIDRTHPNVVEELGGREAAIRLLGKLRKEGAGEGFVMTKYEILDPEDFHTEGENTFVVVPTATEKRLPIGLRLSKSFLLGISPDEGKSWTFVEGGRVESSAGREDVLPKLPAAMKLPKTSSQFIRQSRR